MTKEGKGKKGKEGKGRESPAPPAPGQLSAWAEQLPSGTWRVRWRQPGGKPVTAESDLTKRKAEALVRRLKATKSLPRYPGHAIPLEAIAERYVEARVGEGAMQPGVGADYVAAMSQIQARMGWQSVRDVTPAEIDRWRTATGATSAWRMLRAMLRWSAWRLDQPVDPRLLVRTPPGAAGNRRTEPRLIPDELVHKAVARAAEYGPWTHAMVHWLATYGPRPISLYGVTVGDLDLSARRAVIRHNKNGRAWRHAVLAHTVELLTPCVAGRGAEERVFLDPRTLRPWAYSKQGRSQRFSEWYRRWVAHDFPAEWRGPYVLKDWAISRMDAAGIADHRKQAFTGHIDTISYQRYKKANEGTEDLERLPGAAGPEADENDVELPELLGP